MWLYLPLSPTSNSFLIPHHTLHNFLLFCFNNPLSPIVPPICVWGHPLDHGKSPSHQTLDKGMMHPPLAVFKDAIMKPSNLYAN